MQTQGPFAGRAVIVSGGTRGVGLDVARLFRASGAAVVINGRDEDVLQAAVVDLRASGDPKVAVAGVVGSAALPEVAEDLAATAARLGPIAALINCAGTAEPVGSSILDIDSAAWHDLIAAHLHGTFETCRATVPHLIKTGGAIVNTSSHAFTGIFGGTGYAAGKGAVNSLTYALAAELKEHGVRVNAVCPGASTRLSQGEDYEATVRDLNRRGLLDDMMLSGALAPPPAAYAASAYLYLAHPISAPLSGEILSAAGGYIGRFVPATEQFLSYRDHATTPPLTVEEIDAAVKPR